MADRQMIAGEPKEPTAAQPDNGEASQEQAQKLAEAISAALGDVMSKLQKVLMALQKMGIPPEALQAIAGAYQEFESKVSEVLGGGSPEEEEAPEGSGPVSQEGGVNGKPAV